MLVLLEPKTAHAFSADLDSLSGTNQSFTDDFSERSYGQRFYTTTEKDINRVKEPSVFLTSADKGGALWQARGGTSANVVYDSNVEGAYNDERNELIHSYAANWGLTRREHRTFFSTFYNIDATKNVVIEKNDAVNHKITSEYRYKGSKFRAELTNTFTPGTDYATGNRTELEVAGRKKVRTIADNAQLNLMYTYSPKTELSMLLGYDNFYFPIVDNSEEVNGFSSITYRVAPRINYKWTPKTSLHAAWPWYRTYYYQSGENNSSGFTPSVGIATKLGSKTAAGFDIGYQYRSYQQNILPIDGLTLSAGLYRQLFAKVGGSVYYTRSTTEDFDSLEGQNRSTVTDFYGMNLGWKISKKVEVQLDASMGFDSKEGFITLPDPENPAINFVREQEDVTYQWGIDWNWEPRKYVNFKLGYKYLNKNSSFKDFEYEDHKVVASVNSHF